MDKKNSFVKGTIILIVAGISARIIGFFFRIFLSRILGADGLGIYQLIFPVAGLCNSLCAAGIQIVISRRVAADITSNNSNSLSILKCGLILSLFLSFITAFLLYENASFISTQLLSEERCTIPLQYLSYSIPFSSIHTCICGYYYGQNKAGIPAFSQFLEQVIRVLSTYLIWTAVCKNKMVFDAGNAVIGNIIGELFSSLFCIFTLNISKIHKPDIHLIKSIAKDSVPLTSNRLMLSLFQSVEAIILPLFLVRSGISSKDALSIYGILTGMALPFIMFPATITNAMSTLLLPIIAKADAGNNDAQIKSSSEKTISISLILGIFCLGIFYRYGKNIGIIIFDNITSGYYLIILAWLCPFMYLSTTLSSILNGLGHTTITFLHNILSISIRIVFTLFFVPTLGISAYLCGLLISQFTLSFAQYSKLKKYIKLKIHIIPSIVLPALTAAFSCITADFICKGITEEILNLAGSCLISAGIFFAVMYLSVVKNY